MISLIHVINLENLKQKILNFMHDHKLKGNMELLRMKKVKAKT